jgi:hypothetical protein
MDHDPSEHLFDVLSPAGTEDLLPGHLIKGDGGPFKSIAVLRTGAESKTSKIYLLAAQKTQLLKCTNHNTDAWTEMKENWVSASLDIHT